MEPKSGGDSEPADALPNSNVNAPTRADDGWVVAELCPQCSKVKRNGAGEGWCNALQCAILRGYDTIDQLLHAMDSISPTLKLEDESTEVSVLLLPLFADAEKTAAGLLWEMSSILRLVGCCPIF